MTAGFGFSSFGYGNHHQHVMDQRFYVKCFGAIQYHRESTTYGNSGMVCGSTKGSNDLDVMGVHQQLKSPQDKGSPCLKPRTQSKASGRFLPTLTEFLVLLKVIMHNFNSFAEISTVGIAENMRSLIGLTNDAFEPRKKRWVKS